MKRGFGTWLLFSAFMSAAQADLGDSEALLAAHYGPAVGSRTTDAATGGAVAARRISFQKSGFQVDVLLFPAVSAEESVYHRPYAPITDAEVGRLLAANAQGLDWKEVAPQPEFTTWLHALRSWRRTDGAMASLEGPKNRPRMLFHVTSRQLSEAEAAARK